MWEGGGDELVGSWEACWGMRLRYSKMYLTAPLHANE